MFKSPNGITLIDQWDANVFEKDITTQLILDYDYNDEDKPIYIELNDIDNEIGGVVIDSICIALSEQQATHLMVALREMLREGK